jgi:hypothetical protein
VTWYVTAWRTRGGKTISIARGWDSQAVDLTVSCERRDDRNLRLTPHMISDLLLPDQARIEDYGPGYTVPHAIQDFIDGKWPLSSEQVAWCLEQKVGQTPDFFPAPAPMRVDDEVLSLARDSWILRPDEHLRSDEIQASQAFGGVNLLGETTDTPPPLPETAPATAERHYLPFRSTQGTFRFWLSRRFRRLRQRWLLGARARKIGSKLPW